MSVTFKKVLRKDPFHKDGTGKYYPQLIVWGNRRHWKVLLFR